MNPSLTENRRKVTKIVLLLPAKFTDICKGKVYK